MVETVGPGAIGKHGFDNDRAFTPGRIEPDEPGQRVTGIAVRGRAVDPATVGITPRLELQADIGFWAAVALVDQHREDLLASAEELRRFIPPGFQHLADPSLWRPAARPNTHWSHWFPK